MGKDHGMTRRGLFSALRSPPPTPVTPRRRPPGAIAEREFLAGCTACDECVKACPENAIHTLAEWVGVGARTPVMVPESRPCIMCEGFPCAAACPENVLLVPEAPVWTLGVARVDEGRCLPFKGPECGACAGLCPGELTALTLRRGRPLVDEQRCVGCGLCIQACPVSPAAIELRPLAPATDASRVQSTRSEGR
jgi:ferredoxin-type protein NapG